MTGVLSADSPDPMPRGPRLGALRAFQYIMVRGLGSRPIFQDETDRQGWVDRLTAVGHLAVHDLPLQTTVAAHRLGVTLAADCFVLLRGERLPAARHLTVRALLSNCLTACR